MVSQSKANSAAPDGGKFDEIERLKVALDIADAIVYEWSLTDDTIVWDEKIFSALSVDDQSRLATGAGFKSYLDQDAASLRDKLFDQSGSNVSSYQIEYQFNASAETCCWIEDSGRRVLGADGQVERLVGVIRIITENKLREQRLNYLASYDDLTGLLNRSRLRECLDQAIYAGEHQGAQGAYLVAGIDALSAVNADYGFDIADEVIAGVGERLQQVAGSEATIGRVAGSKFGIVIPVCDDVAIRSIAKEFVDSVYVSVIDTSSSPIAATISIGAVSFPDGAKNSLQAMARAEQALDASKHAGRSTVNVFDSTKETEFARLRNAQIGDEIVAALNDRRICLAYQPIVCAETLKVREYECLIRMVEENGDIRAAGEFIPHAERLGLVRMLDRRALELAVETLQERPDLRFAINVSGVTATEAVGLEGYLKHIEANKNVADRMTVELTETSNLRSLEESVRFLSRLRDLGCRIAIDDFGAGYTSFRNLQALVVDSVKIDGTFIRGVIQNQDNQVFVRTLLELAQNFGLETVAEWVGDSEEADLLRRYGVNFLQGFYIGAPRLDIPGEGATFDQATLQSA